MVPYFTKEEIYALLGIVEDEVGDVTAMPRLESMNFSGVEPKTLTLNFSDETSITTEYLPTLQVLEDATNGNSYLLRGRGSSETGTAGNNVILGFNDSVSGGWGNLIGGTWNTLNASQSLLAGYGNNILEGTFSNVVGGSYNTIRTNYSAIFGYYNEDRHPAAPPTLPNPDGGNLIAGFYNYADNAFGMTITGSAHTQTGNNVLVAGQASKNLNGTTANINNNSDARFIVGNGTINTAYAPTSTSNAFVVRQSGLVTAPSLTSTLIDSDVKSLITKEYLDSNVATSTHAHDWTEINNKPTTYSGYGLTLPSLQDILDTDEGKWNGLNMLSVYNNGAVSSKLELKLEDGDNYFKTYLGGDDYPFFEFMGDNNGLFMSVGDDQGNFYWNDYNSSTQSTNRIDAQYGYTEILNFAKDMSGNNLMSYMYMGENGVIRFQTGINSHNFKFETPDTSLLTGDGKLLLPPAVGTFTMPITVNGVAADASGDITIPIDGQSHTHAWSSITDTPTTLAGYGLATDADARYVNVSGDDMTGPLKIVAADNTYPFTIQSATEVKFKLRTKYIDTIPDNTVFNFGLYSDTTPNTGINFYRGQTVLGGWMTFTTNDGTERVKIDNTGNTTFYGNIIKDGGLNTEFLMADGSVTSNSDYAILSQNNTFTGSKQTFDKLEIETLDGGNPRIVKILSRGNSTNAGWHSNLYLNVFSNGSDINGIHIIGNTGAPGKRIINWFDTIMETELEVKGELIANSRIHAKTDVKVGDFTYLNDLTESPYKVTEIESKTNSFNGWHNKIRLKFTTNSGNVIYPIVAEERYTNPVQNTSTTAKIRMNGLIIPDEVDFTNLPTHVNDNDAETSGIENGHLYVEKGTGYVKKKTSTTDSSVALVATSRNFTEDDNGKVLLITTNVTLTYPAIGVLPKGFKCDLDVDTGAQLTIADSAATAGSDLDAPNGTTLDANKSGSVYVRPDDSRLRIKKSFL